MLMSKSTINTMPEKYDVRQGQSIELLKELHILTRDGKMNQDSRRKLKQIYHLYQFIEPFLNRYISNGSGPLKFGTLVDHGAGKSYLGFILYDLFFKNMNTSSQVFGIETRTELVSKSQELATRLDFKNMSFLNLSVLESISSPLLPDQVDIVTALHACDTATDDAISFALHKQAKVIILVPCCQAEIASLLRKHKSKQKNNILSELWSHPIHTREFGSHITNVLRALQLEAHGYQVTVTELVGWEHSMKNELIIAEYKNSPRSNARERLSQLLLAIGLEDLTQRYTN